MVGGALMLVGAAAAAIYVVDRSRCPSQADLERARAPEEVADAFADDGVPLTPITLPRAVVRDDPAYRGAEAFRYVDRGAALYVLVCRVRCVDAPRGLRDQPVRLPPGSPQHVRQFSTLGNNIAIFMTDGDRRSGRELQARVQPVVNELDAAVPYASHCYEQ